jgi:hypothetical protein
MASLLAAGAAQPAASPLPDGIYRYVIIDGGKSEATSVIRVTRSHGDLVVEEHASPMEETESSRRRLDPATFAMRSYEDDFDGKPLVALTIDGTTATLRQATGTTKISALTGAPFVVFDYFVASFFALPAILREAQTSTLSLVVVGADKAQPMTASASAAERPAGIATTDASIAVTIEDAIATLWYDPQTLVLNELDLPRSRIVYKRVSTVLLAGPPMAARSDVSGATATLNKFYSWYHLQPNHEWTGHFGQVKALFDPGLYAMLEAVLHSKANQQEPIMDFDPFVNAQWDAKSYALGTPIDKGADVQVPVTLNLSGSPNAKTKLIAVLRKNVAGMYVIYNFIYDPTFNLRDFLRKQLKK